MAVGDHVKLDIFSHASQRNFQNTFWLEVLTAPTNPQNECEGACNAFFDDILTPWRDLISNQSNIDCAVATKVDGVPSPKFQRNFQNVVGTRIDEALPSNCTLRINRRAQRSGKTIVSGLTISGMSNQDSTLNVWTPAWFNTQVNAFLLAINATWATSTPEAMSFAMVARDFDWEAIPEANVTFDPSANTMVRNDGNFDPPLIDGPGVIVKVKPGDPLVTNNGTYSAIFGPANTATLTSPNNLEQAGTAPIVSLRQPVGGPFYTLLLATGANAVVHTMKNRTTKYSGAAGT